MPVEARLWDDGELLDAIAADLVAVGVAVPVYNALPGDLARWSPRFAGGHMIGWLDARPSNVDQKVLWCDPLGVGDYHGEWVSFRRVKPFLSQAGGRIFATTIPIGAAMSTSLTLDRVLPTGTVAVLHKGVATYRFDDERLTFVEDKPVVANAKPLADTQVAVDQQPRGKGRPIGRFVRIANGPAAGRYLRFNDITLREPVAGDPIDAQAIRDAALAEGIAIGVAQERARFQLVDEPVYRQAEAVPA